MKTKILHIIGTIDVGGAETLLLKILSSWKDTEFCHSVYYVHQSNKLRDDFEKINVSPRLLDLKSERDFFKIPGLITLFRRERPHIVHTNLWTGNYLIAIAARLARVPVIIETIHGAFKCSRSGYFIHRLLRPTMRYIVDGTICVGSGVKNYLKNSFKQSSDKIHVIYNGLDPIRANDNKNISLLKDELRLSESPVLVTVANLQPIIKGYEDYIEALMHVTKMNNVNFQVLIVGDSVKDYPEFPQKLKMRIKELNLDNKVRFLGYRSDVPLLLTISDIFVLPSRYEGAPLSIIEAMRAGLPVIATRTGAVPEYVIDRETGIIVEPGDSTALAGAIDKLLRHPEKWKTMGDKGREHFEKNFTIDKTVENLTELYRSLLQKKIPSADNI